MTPYYSPVYGRLSTLYRVSSKRLTHQNGRYRSVARGQGFLVLHLAGNRSLRYLAKSTYRKHADEMLLSGHSCSCEQVSQPRDALALRSSF